MGNLVGKEDEASMIIDEHGRTRYEGRQSRRRPSTNSATATSSTAPAQSTPGSGASQARPSAPSGTAPPNQSKQSSSSSSTAAAPPPRKSSGPAAANPSDSSQKMYDTNQHGAAGGSQNQNGGNVIPSSSSSSSSRAAQGDQHPRQNEAPPPQPGSSSAQQQQQQQQQQQKNTQRPSDGGITEAEVDQLLEDLERDDKVPMVFRWDGGGRNVYITGTFNRWTEKIPMRRSGNDFLYIRELKRGKHAYKFIVDDEWRFAPDQPTVADPQGYINNFVDLTDFKETYGADMKSLQDKDHITGDDLYNNFRPDPEDPQWYAKEPPPLPPHLRHIILNTPQANDAVVAKSIQVPQHVTLNHLYCSAIKENLMVLGVTQRYKEKFVTTVFYSPLPDAKIVGRAAAAAEKLRTGAHQ